MPITANIIQAMKHTVNENVLMMTTDHAFLLLELMLSSGRFAGNNQTTTMVWKRPQQKNPH
jgi:hypothetical protein